MENFAADVPNLGKEAFTNQILGLVQLGRDQQETWSSSRYAQGRRIELL